MLTRISHCLWMLLFAGWASTSWAGAYINVSNESSAALTFGGDESTHPSGQSRWKWVDEVVNVRFTDAARNYRYWASIRDVHIPCSIGSDWGWRLDLQVIAIQSNGTSDPTGRPYGRVCAMFPWSSSNTNSLLRVLDNQIIFQRNDVYPSPIALTDEDTSAVSVTFAQLALDRQSTSPDYWNGMQASVPPEDGMYRIHPIYNLTDCANLEGDRAKDNTSIIQWPCQPPSHVNDQWQVTGNVSGYEIRSRWDRGRCISDPADRPLDAGVGLVSDTCDGESRQYWLFIPTLSESGLQAYRIQNVGSGLVFHIPQKSFTNGVQLIQWGGYGPASAPNETIDNSSWQLERIN